MVQKKERIYNDTLVSTEEQTTNKQACFNKATPQRKRKLINAESSTNSSKIKKIKKVKDSSKFKPINEQTQKRNRINKVNYIDTVRKKDERAKLKGYPCSECKEWYEWVEEHIPPHMKDPNYKNVCDHVSRHRHQCTPSLTPEGFWDLNFVDE